MSTPASPLDPGSGASASRYEMLATIASGGMATVYVGRLRGMGGFSRMVAVKRAHPHLLTDPTYRAMLVDEARLAAKLHHPNVVAVLDVEELEGELSLVMDYVEGTSLFDLIEASQANGGQLSPRIAMRITLDACAGLHAAHMLSDEFGRPLGLVHRDVSPQNILVGIDGAARLSDFGIAKHAEGAATTTGVLKGKLSYMAPEYLESTRLDARSDVFSMGVVAWEALAGQKLFRGKSELETFKNVIATAVPPLSSVAPWANERLDAILFGALARAPEHRYQSAEDFAVALESEARYSDLIATPAEVGACVRELFGEALAERRAEIRKRSGPVPIERGSGSGRTSAPGGARTSVPGSARTSAPGSADARSQAATMVDRPPTPVPASAEASGLQRKAQRADPEPAPLSDVDPVQVPRSNGALWKGALILGLLAAAGGAIAFAMTRSGGDTGSAGAPSSTATASAVAQAAPEPTASAPAPTASAPAPTASAPAPTANAAAPTANATSIGVNDLPDVKPAFSTSRPGGKLPGKRTPAPDSYPVTTGIPLSAWPPARPPATAPPPPPSDF